MTTMQSSQQITLQHRVFFPKSKTVWLQKRQTIIPSSIKPWRHKWLLAWKKGRLWQKSWSRRAAASFHSGGISWAALLSIKTTEMPTYSLVSVSLKLVTRAWSLKAPRSTLQLTRPNTLKTRCNTLHIQLTEENELLTPASIGSPAIKKDSD